jgi:hypothetical protein
VNHLTDCPGPHRKTEVASDLVGVRCDFRRLTYWYKRCVATEDGGARCEDYSTGGRLPTCRRHKNVRV